MTNPILVTGGTGTLGRLVVPRLRDAGFRVRVLSRHGGPPEEWVEHVTGDLDTGVGISEGSRFRKTWGRGREGSAPWVGLRAEAWAKANSRAEQA